MLAHHAVERGAELREHLGPVVELLLRAELAEVAAEHHEVGLRSEEVRLRDRPDQTAVPVADELGARDVLDVGVRDVGEGEVLRGVGEGELHEAHGDDAGGGRRRRALQEIATAGDAGVHRFTSMRAALGRRGELGARQRLHERDEVVDLLLGQVQRPDAAAEEVVDGIPFLRHPAVVVVDDHVPQRLQAAVVHVGRGDGHVAQRRRLEGAEVVEVAGDGEAAELGGPLVAEHLHVHLGERRLRLQERPGQLRHVLLDVVDADPDVVEAVVGEERLGLLDPVAGHAAALVHEEVEASLLRVGQRLRVAAVEVAVEGRVPRPPGSARRRRSPAGPPPS